MYEILAVVVTYNRKKLLEECILALKNQTFQDFDLLIIDNASTDNTYDYIKKYLSEKIKYSNVQKNLGGAGGFSLGIKQAVESGYKYAWVMDDDSIPQPGALESICKKISKIGFNFSFVSSLVHWTDGTLFPMNVPHVVENISEFIEEVSDYRLLRVKSGSFVGCFINLQTVVQVGLPISSFFIYGDDAEFTRRISKIKPAYWDYDSLIIHKAPSKVGADIVLAPSDRIDRYYFQHRNGLYIARKKGLANVFTRLKIHVKRFIGVLFRSPDHKAKRMWVIIKGTWAGFWYNPEIEFPTKS